VAAYRVSVTRAWRNGDFCATVHTSTCTARATEGTRRRSARLRCRRRRSTEPSSARCTMSADCLAAVFATYCLTPKLCGDVESNAGGDCQDGRMASMSFTGRFSGVEAASPAIFLVRGCSCASVMVSSRNCLWLDFHPRACLRSFSGGGNPNRRASDFEFVRSRIFSLLRSLRAKAKSRRKPDFGFRFGRACPRLRVVLLNRGRESKAVEHSASSYDKRS